MSREIDERIVAMYFDNKNFESGAQQTLKTLEQLKQSCNMEGVGKGLEAFEDISKKMNIDDLRKKTDKVKTSFESLGNVMKKVFNAALTPVRAIKNEIDTLNGYIGKVFGIDLASKIVGSLESTFRSLTVAPISAGWSQYENTMDSVKTIMSSTGESIEAVKGKLGEMTEYANKTIYSLNDMTSNLGKFTNNGVKLEDATNAMIGLANATADAGQGAQQASMAMYNVSQAIGVGKMTTIDWKSLENANIATKKLKQTFIDAAVAHGTLEKKIEKDAQSGAEVVKYYTKAEKGAKAMEVSVENFRETLNKGWLDKASMMDTFAIFSGQLGIEEIAALGFSKEESARLYQIGQEAMKAATEVRTFSKMMDALRESVQSSWATSFEYIFGDMEEGTNLWTMINDKIDGILSKSAENRNNILLSWRGMMYDEDGQIRKIRDVYETRKEMLRREYDEGRISSQRYAEELTKLEETLGDKKLWIDYREIAIETFNNIFDVISSISGAVKGAWTDVFGEFNADTLKNLTQGFREFVDSIKKWLGSADDADSRISKIRKGLSGLFTVLKIGLNVIKGVIEAAWEIVKPFFDPIINLFSKFGEWVQLDDIKNFGDMVGKLGEKFKDLWGKLTKLGWQGALSKIGEWFSGIWANVKSGIRNWMNDNGLGGVVEWFSNLRAKIEEGINTVREWWNDPGNNIANFFKGIYESITGWFKRGTDDRGFEMYSPIEQFFYKIKTGVTNAFNTVKSWWEGSGIPEFFSDMWNAITGLFQTEEHKTAILPTGERREWTETHNAPIVQFFLDLKDKLVSTFEEVQGWGVWDTIGNFFGDVWEKISGLFQTEVHRAEILPTGERREWVETRTAPIVQFFIDLKDKLVSTFEEVRGWGVWDTIGDFFSDVWKSITDMFQTEIQHVAILPSGERRELTETRTAPIVQFFIDLKDSLVKTFEEVQAWPIWKIIGNFFSGIWESVSDVFKTEVHRAEILPTGERREWVEKRTAPIVQFFENMKSEIEGAWKGVTSWEGWDEVGKFFSDIWAWVTDKFSKGKSSGSATTATEESDKKVGIITQVIETLSGFWGSVTEWFNSIGGGEIADRFLTSFTKLLEVVATIAEELVDFAHHVVTGNLDLQTIVEIFGIIAGLKFLKRTRHDLAIISQNATGIGETMLQIAGAVSLISLAVSVIGGMSIENIAKGVGAVVVITLALVALVKKLQGLNAIKLGSMDEPEKAWERVVGKLISSLAMVGMLKILMDGLPTVIDAMSNAKKYSGLDGDDLMKALIGMMTAISGLMIGFGIVQRLAPSGLDPAATGKTLISILEIVGGFILGMFASGGIMELAKGIFGDQAITDVMNGAAQLFEGLGKVFGSFFKGLLGLQTDEEKLDAGMDNLETLSKFSEGFTLEKTSGIARILTLITNLTKVSKDINTGDLTNFATAAEQLALGMLKFSWVVEGIDDMEGIGRAGEDRYQAISEAADLMRHLMESFDPLAAFGTSGARFIFSHLISEFGTFASNEESVKSYVDGLNNIIDAMGGLHDGSNVKFEGIDIVKKMYDSIQLAFDNPSKDLPEFNASPVIDAILKALNIADPQITEAIHTMIQNGLTGLSTETAGYDLSGIDGLSNLVNTLQTLSNPVENVADSFGFDTATITKNINEMIKGLNTEEWNLDSLNLPVDFNILGDVDEDGTPSVLSQIETQWADFQAKVESGEYDANLEIKIRPILDTTEFNTEFESFKKLFGDNVPISMGAVIDIGDQPLPIDDSNLLAELRELKYELRNTASILQSTMYNVDGDLVNHIDGVTNAVRNIRINTVKNTLKDIDEGLYRAAVNSAMTGVSTYPQKAIALPD